MRSCLRFDPARPCAVWKPRERESQAHERVRQAHSRGLAPAPARRRWPRRRRSRSAGTCRSSGSPRWRDNARHRRGHADHGGRARARSPSDVQCATRTWRRASRSVRSSRIRHLVSMVSAACRPARASMHRRPLRSRSAGGNWIPVDRSRSPSRRPARRFSFPRWALANPRSPDCTKSGRQSRGCGQGPARAARDPPAASAASQTGVAGPPRTIHIVRHWDLLVAHGKKRRELGSGLVLDRPWARDPPQACHSSRCVCGDPRLADRLRRTTHTRLPSSSGYATSSSIVSAMHEPCP